MPVGLLGRKVGMTQVYTDDGDFIPVTVVEAGPCVVLQLKTVERDGYEAVPKWVSFGQETARRGASYPGQPGESQRTWPRGRIVQQAVQGESRGRG
ncbi:MAG: hypothetical protein Ct9H300mP1_07970 [Planctomycetaceae bacterium]|nr:MAG: hypothetical protein Ct9H300mP1_07970 [Planctomycetaceae bacterium]